MIPRGPTASSPVTPLASLPRQSPTQPHGPAGRSLLFALQQLPDRGADEGGGGSMRRVANRLADAISGGLVEAEGDYERLSRHSGS